jgi:biotin operon repressor
VRRGAPVTKPQLARQLGTTSRSVQRAVSLLRRLGMPIKSRGNAGLAYRLPAPRLDLAIEVGGVRVAIVDDDAAHPRARLRARTLLAVDAGTSWRDAVRETGVSHQAMHKWLARYRRTRCLHMHERTQ